MKRCDKRDITGNAWVLMKLKYELSIQYITVLNSRKAYIYILSRASAF